MRKAKFDEKTVAQICNQLTAQDIDPTIKNVTEHLGGGSPNAVLNYIKIWRKHYELANTVEADLSAEVRQAILAECAQKMLKVRQRLQRQIEERDHQIGELQGILEALELQISDLSSQNRHLNQESQAKSLHYEAKLAAAEEQAKVRMEQLNEVRAQLSTQEREHRRDYQHVLEAKHQADIKAAATEAKALALEKQLQLTSNIR